MYVELALTTWIIPPRSNYCTDTDYDPLALVLPDTPSWGHRRNPDLCFNGLPRKIGLYSNVQRFVYVTAPQISNILAFSTLGPTSKLSVSTLASRPLVYSIVTSRC